MTIAHDAHPSTGDHDLRHEQELRYDQDHPHACLNGYIYLGYTYVGEDGDEVETYEAIPCRRCLADVVDDVER
jgi:hypothetical protein